jgi:hypothetical protein
MYDTDEARAMAQKKLDFFFGVVSDVPIRNGNSKAKNKYRRLVRGSDL